MTTAFNRRTYFARESAAKSAATPTLKNEMESSHGVRYSELHRLTCFNLIRMHMVDPMHFLFLGIAKYVFVTWINMNILDSNKLVALDNKMVKIKLPVDVVRITGTIQESL